MTKRAGRAEYRPYTPQDMMKVREYISRVYSRLKRPNSWSIARWEFEIFFIQKRAGMLPGWEQHIGLWEDEGVSWPPLSAVTGTTIFSWIRWSRRRSCWAKCSDS